MSQQVAMSLTCVTTGSHELYMCRYGYHQEQSSTCVAKTLSEQTEQTPSMVAVYDTQIY